MRNCCHPAAGWRRGEESGARRKGANQCGGAQGFASSYHPGRSAIFCCACGGRIPFWIDGVGGFRVWVKTTTLKAHPVKIISLDRYSQSPRSSLLSPDFICENRKPIKYLTTSFFPCWGASRPPHHRSPPSLQAPHSLRRAVSAWTAASSRFSTAASAALLRARSSSTLARSLLRVASSSAASSSGPWN